MRRFFSTLSTLLMLAVSANSQVVVNEFCASSDTLDIKGHVSDWVELYNTGSQPVNIRGYALSDKAKNPQKYVIDSDVIVFPGGYVLVMCNGLGSGVNTNFKLSASGGEVLLWSDPSGNIINKIDIPVLRRDYSYGRVQDGGSEWATFSLSSPAMPNQPQYAQVPKPTFSVTPGFYSKQQQVAIECALSSATIYYTTDGSEPSTQSRRYNSPISVGVGQNMVIRAIAVDNSRQDSEIESGTYFINSRQIDLPVISLITNSKNFFDPKIGIYVEGTNGVAGPCTDGVPKNWHQDWERPVHIEYFDRNKKLQISQDAGVKITGSCSRNQAMKSLRIIARKQYGDTRLRYKFFDKKDISEFKSIVLRNGANDFGYTMYRDGLVTGLAGESLDIDVQAFQPAVVFLNGQYLGLHNIREKVSSHYLEENYGVDADMVDILENDGFVNEGSNYDYQAMIDFVRNNSLSNPANYAKVAAQMDISNFIDYWCAQIYIDNEDWPNNNIKWWRSQGVGSKWRWIMFGAEFSCNIYGGGPERNSVYNAIDANSTAWGSNSTWWSNILIRKLLENDGFRNQFIQRMAYLMDHTYNYSRVEEFSDSLQNLIANEWYPFADRWPDWWHDNWYGNCWNMKEWFRRRPEYIEQYIQSYFGVGPRFQLEVSSDNGGAKFSLNGSMPTANINGSYFSGATIEVGASLPKGTQVDYWELDGKGLKANTSIDYGSDGWMYYNQGQEPPNYWKNFYYDESGWKSGKAPLGYSGSNSEATKLQYGNDPNNKWISYYFRKKFNIDADQASIASAQINLKVDDGAIVYVNGQEVGRIMMPAGYVDFNTWASSYYADVNDLPVNTIVVPANLLNKGENMLVVELHQCSNVSSDIHIDAQITYSTLGGKENYKVSTPTISFLMGSDTRLTLHTKSAANPPDRTESVNGLYVNEIMPYNGGALSDEHNNFPAWIELYNSTSKAIDLQGLYVMDKKTEYQLPACSDGQLTIPAHGYLVLFADGKPELGPLHLGISLKPDKANAIYLGEKINGKSNYIHWLEFPELDRNQSFGLREDGGDNASYFSMSTPYASNSTGVTFYPEELFTVVEEIDHSRLSNVLRVYPNPTQGTVYIDTDEGQAEYLVLSTSGKLLLKGTGNQIDMSPLSPGLYIVRIRLGHTAQCVRLIRL